MYARKTNISLGNFSKEIKRNNVVIFREPIQFKKVSLRENISKYFAEFSRSTGIHGIRYVGESGLFLIEKIIWTLVLIVLCYFCINLIAVLYNKWKTSPVVVSFTTTETPIWQIPFPAVTICPQVKTDPTIFNYTKVYLRKRFKRPVTTEEDKYFESMALVCHNAVDMDLDMLSSDHFSSIVNKSAIDDLIKIATKFNSDNSHVYWLGKQRKFEKMVSQVFTSEGVCLVFNMLNQDEFLIDQEKYFKKRNINKPRHWTLESGYPPEDTLDTYPLRTSVPGLNGGIDFELAANETHLDYICGEAFQGFKVALHHPAEFPNFDHFFRLPLDQATMVAVKPRMITVSNELMHYSVKDRMCFFGHERQLKFFKSYTQQNCFNECLSNYTLRLCKCVPFYMPKMKLSPICGPARTLCVLRSKVQYHVSEADGSLNNNNCNCLPSCTSLVYDVEISQINWDWETAIKKVTNWNESELSTIKNTHLSKISVYFSELQFFAAKRHELYGSTDFFSNIGGILGLFIGFSVTSLIEIIYFLTLRIVCNMKMYRPRWTAN